MRLRLLAQPSSAPSLRGRTRRAHYMAACHEREQDRSWEEKVFEPGGKVRGIGQVLDGGKNWEVRTVLSPKFWLLASFWVVNFAYINGWEDMEVSITCFLGWRVSIHTIVSFCRSSLPSYCSSVGSSPSWQVQKERELHWQVFRSLLGSRPSSFMTPLRDEM